MRPRAPMPQLEVKFRRFTSLNTTIRLREGGLIVRLSDLLEHAPETGHHYDLNEVFESLNARFFHGLLGRPTLTWSAHFAKRMLGHFDAAHNTIVVSRVFDRPNTPRYAIEYLLYHEMLHLKHPVRVRAGRRCVHSREFQAEERLFPELESAREYLKRL